MFDWFGWHVRRSLPIGPRSASVVVLVIAACASAVWSQVPAQGASQDAMTQEAPASGNIQGVVRDDSGNAIEGARVLFNSPATFTRGVTRSGKDGAYVTEQVPPGTYLVRVEGRDMVEIQSNVVVEAGKTASVDFKLEWINPGPIHLESTFNGTAPDVLAIDGRNFLNAGQLEPGTQAVDGRALDPGKTGYQSLSINMQMGRTTRYDMDEVEVMDETKGAITQNLPTAAVREVTISRGMPQVFQSLNADGAVQISTRSAVDSWHSNLFFNFRDQFLGMAGYPHGGEGFSRQQYGFATGGALIKNKLFLSLVGERTKQDGQLPAMYAFPAVEQNDLRSANFDENMLTARLDYNYSENMKWFLRWSYDNASQLGPPDSRSNFRDQINVPATVFGVDWNHGAFQHSARFGYQKLVNAINPDFSDTLSAPFHIQLGTYALGPTVMGPRQTIQRDLYARYDSRMTYKVNHALRFGGAVHRIAQGDIFAPGAFGPSVTSSNGLDTILAVNSNPNLFPIIPGDPRGAADDPLNYPVGTVTIFNGLGNFSEHSVFNSSSGGHFDTRLEGYVGDTFNAFPNINITLGLNYVWDSGRTDSDLAPIPCSAVTIPNPPCTSGLVLDQFGLLPYNQPGTPNSLGGTINRPAYNFAPQLGIAWDPGHSGRTVIRASVGMFYDNFLLQNTYQDRINRLSSGQYNRSLTLCPTGSVLFPDGSVVSSVDGLDISRDICGAPIGSVAPAIQDLQQEFLLAQSAVTGGPNIYSLANSVANFGGLLAPSYKTPRVVHMSFGLQHQLGAHSMFSADFMRQIGTQFPMGIDTNHVGDAGFLTDGSNTNPLLNTYASELSAINSTLLSNPASAGCPQATFAGSSSQASVSCYLSTVTGASITDFARHGLDSSNAFCGPFPCSVLGKQQAAFGGINPAVGSNLMYFPGGRSQYQGLHVAFKTTLNNPSKRVSRVDIGVAYTVSRYRTNVAEPDGSGGDYSILTPALDYNRPHLGHFGVSGMDRTNILAFTSTADLEHGLKLSMIANLASPLPLSVFVPQADGGGVPGEIFRSDETGDGTVGDLLPATYVGSTGKYSTSKVTKAIAFYDSSFAGKLTPAGQVLVGSQLVTGQQLVALGAYSPLIQSPPGHFAEATWLKTMDLKLNRPFKVGERVVLDPTFAVFNVFNWANFGGAGNQLNGILDGAPGSSLNNASSAGFCGNSTAFCTSRLDRVLTGSGTYSNGAPRQMEFGLRIIF